MGKRILSFLLAFVLVLGMVPANALGVFAAETEQVTVDYEAAYVSSIFPNGVLSEGNWLGGSKLSGGQAFDILWDGGNLYFGVVPGAEDTELTVKIGSTVVAKVTKNDPARWNTGVEIRVPYTTEGVTVLENVSLTMGTSTWTGNVGLVNKEISKVNARELNTKTTNMTYTADGSGIVGNMPAAITEPGASEYYQRDYAHNSTALPILSSKDGGMKVEYTFTATDMPAVTHVRAVGVIIPVYAGYTNTITTDDGGILGGIANTADGLQYIHNYISLDANSKAEYKTTCIKLNKQEGDTFRVGLDVKADGSMDVLVDGTTVGSVAAAYSDLAAMEKAGAGTASTYVVNTYRYGYNGKTTDGFYRYEDIQYTVKDLLITKDVTPVYEDLTAQTDGKLSAFFTEEPMTVDAASWAYADKERFVAGVAEAFALIRNNQVYVMVTAPNAASVTATLGGETETAAAVNGTAVLRFGDTMLTELGQEISFQATVTDTAGATSNLWENPGKLVVTGKKVSASVYAVPTAFTMNAGAFAGSSSRTETSWNFTATHVMTQNSNCVAAVLNKSEQAAQQTIDFNKAILLEQELDIDSMPHGAVSGNWEGPITGYGLTIMLENTSPATWAAVVYPDEQGNLHLRFYHYDKKTSHSIDLGKQVGGDTFTLGLLWNPADSTTTVLVDGVKMGVLTDSTIYGAKAYGYITALLKYYDKAMDGTETAQMASSNLRITAYDPKAVLETVTALEDAPEFVCHAPYTGGTVTWSAARPMSAKWDSANLYLAVKPAEPSADLTVKVGEKSVTVNASSANVAVSGSHWNVTIPLADLGIALTDYNFVTTMTLSGAYTWKGSLLLTYETGGKVTTATPAITSHDAENATNKSVISGNDIRFAIEYKESKVDVSFDRVYSHTGGVKQLDATNAEILGDIHVLEFDFRADAMPAVDAGIVGGCYACQGFTLGVQWVANSNAYGYNAGISNIKGRGMTFVIQTGEGTGCHYIDLGKEVGDTFHIRLEYDATAIELKVYCDGQMVGSLNKEEGLSLRSWGGTAQLVMLNLYTSGSSVARPAGIPMDFTVSNLNSYTMDNDPYVLAEDALDYLTFETIKGSNKAENAVVSDLNLPATLNHPMFNGYSLTWTSDNESYITSDGKVTAPDGDATATVTVTVAGTDVSKTFTLSAVKQSMDAIAISNTVPVETMVIDGVLNEVSWSIPYALTAKTGTGVDGIAHVVWGKGMLYLGVRYTGANQITLKLGDKTWTLDLAASMASADGLVKGVAKDGIAELAIDLLGCGIEPTAYNQHVNFNLTLTDGTNSASVTGEETLKLVFSGKEASRFGLANMTKHPGGNLEGLVNSNEIHLITEDATRRYLMLYTSRIDHAYDIYFEQTLTIAKMESTGKLGDGVSSGYCFWISAAAPKPEGHTGSYGEIAQGNLWNDNGALILRVNRAANASDYVDIPLGVGLNETFTLGFLWGKDDSVEVYVNEQLKGTVENVTFVKSGLGDDAFALNTGCVVDITIQNVIFTIKAFDTVPAYDLAALLGDCDVNNITENLPNKFTVGHFTFNVDWNSSNTDVITDAGVVTRPDTASATLTLSPVVGGKALGEVTVTVPPYSMTYEDLDAAITWETIAGGNARQDLVVGDLTLPGSINVQTIDRALIWTSSNPDVISAAGAVKRAEKDTVVTLSVAFVDAPAIVKTFTITVPGTKAEAYFTSDAMAADGNLDEDAWNYANWKPFTAGTTAGETAALIHAGAAFIAVKLDAAQAVTFTLGEKTFTVAADGTVTDPRIFATVNGGNMEICVDLKALDMQLLDYSGEFAFQVELADGTKLEAEPTKLTIPELRILKEGNPVDLTGALINKTVINGNSLKINVTGAFDNSTTTYMIYKALNQADFAYDMLLEQTITINSIAVSEESGKFEGEFVGNGYLTLIHDVDKEMFAVLVYADADNNLYLSARIASGTSEPVALGKKVGDTFTLGTNFGINGIIDIYVDGVHVGTIANSKRPVTVYADSKVLLIKYMDAGCKDGVTANIEVTDIKLSVKNEKYPLVATPTLLEEMTEKAILGDLDISALTESDVIPNSFYSAYLGDLDLQWISTDDSVISVVDGRITGIHQQDFATGKTTLTAYYNGTKLFAKEVTVASRYELLDSLLTQTPITVDGVLAEPDWASWNAYSGEGYNAGIASVWSKGQVFFAVNATGGDTLVLEIGERAITFNLNNCTYNADLADQGIQIAKNGNVVEIGIPMELLGVSLTDYNQVAHFSAWLAGTQEYTLVENAYLRFSGIIAVSEALGSYTKAGFAVSSNSATFKGEENGTTNYIYEPNNPIDNSVPFLISQDMLFNELPVYNGNYNSGLQANGYYGWVTDGGISASGGTEGMVVFHSVYRPDASTKELVLRMRTAAGFVDYSLGEKLGVSFRLSYIWNPDNTVVVFVDGQYLGTVQDAAYYASGCGADCITYRYYSKASTNTVDFTISNVMLVKMAYESALDELTPAAVFGRIDLAHVRKDLPMVSTFESANFAQIPMTWVSSDESVVSNTGVITRHATETKTATVTLYVGETELWSVDITVDPMSVTDQSAPRLINTAFTAEDVVIDGTIADQGWTMNGWVLNGNSQICGKFGSQWDQTTLYLAIDFGAADSLQFTLGDAGGSRTTFTVDLAAKTLKCGDEIVDGAVISISGTVAEIELPLSVFTVSKINSYNVNLGIQVALSFGETTHKYTGTLVLTSIDWWLTENAEHAMPVLESQYKSVSYKGGAPDGNQGAVRTETGWRIYDLYNENGENPAGVRTYILFMRQPVYEDFDDRRQAVHVEFDFLAESLPEWEIEGHVDIGSAFANYGLTFSLADKADSAKFSNVAVGGIMNTKDGLVLVIKRGSTETIPLNKQVGEQFRLGMSWQPNGDMVITIDGEHFYTVSQMSNWVGSVGDCSFVINMLRDTIKPTSEADDMEIFIDNLAFGKGYSQEGILNRVTAENLLGENDGVYNVTTDLALPTVITNGQLDETYTVTWTSDNAAISADGTVTRPATGGVMVTLTATASNGETKSYEFIVVGEEVGNDGTLVVVSDTDPADKGGTASDSVLFTLDATNNSVIRDQGESKAFNLVTLTDIDAVSRLNRESISLWVSDDNVTYTEVRNFMLNHDGVHWYLYDIYDDQYQTVSARYVKVHYNHFDADDSDFVAVLATMVQVSFDESLVQPPEKVALDVLNESDAVWQDEAVTVQLPEGITAEGLRVTYGDGLHLYHYVAENGTLVVRVPDLDPGVVLELSLWNAEGGINLQNKEAVYEVTYGTRETYRNNGGRWVLNLNKGMTFPGADGVLGTADDITQEKDAILAMNGAGTRISYDYGYTWSTYASFAFEDPKYPGNGDWILDEGETKLNLNGAGGYIVNRTTGRIMYETHVLAPKDYFVAGDKTKSDCRTAIIGSDDGGKTWRVMDILDQGFDENSTYVLSYSDGVQLSTYDGDGPNVDFVFNMGAQYNNNGAFCGRVAYTRDAGESWEFSTSCITFGNEFAFEGGVSECTILEREDGTLVLYGRCQSTFVDQFAISYSLDHGVTWLTPAEASSIYTVNTQPVMFTYELSSGIKIPLMTWGGNNIRGGDSYIRNPFNIALSLNGLDTFRNIQNSFSKTFMEDYTGAASHYITNASMQQMNGDDLIVTFSRLSAGDSVTMMIKDFSDWYTRTKGAYDSFEHGTAKYEGWVTVVGGIAADKSAASKGAWSMLVNNNSNVTRSVPYLQDGQVSLDVFVDASTDFTLELQSAYSSAYGDDATPIGIQVIGNELFFLGADGASGLTLKEGWNTLTFQLNLSAADPTATLSVNDGEAVAIPVDEAAGDYVCYITIGTGAKEIHVDELLVTSTLAAAVEVTDADKAAAEAVIDMIKAIGEVTAEDEEAIAAARNAYNAMTQVQRDLVNRRVRISEEDVAMTPGTDVSEYMVNYHDVLTEAEAALEKLALPLITGNLSLNDTVDINFIIPAGIDVEENVLVVKNAATGEDVEYTLLPMTDNTTVVRFSAKSNHMTDEITVQVFDSNGNPLTQQASMSVRKYAQKLLANCDDTLKMLLIRMLDYGALAQINSGDTTDLANSIVTDELRAFANNYEWNEAVNLDIPAGSGGVFQAYLALNETIDVTVSVASSYVEAGDKFVVKRNGVELSEDDYILVEQSNSYLIRCSVNSDAMTDEIYIAIVGEDGAVKKETTLGVRIYAQKFLAAVPTGDQAAMLLAMLDYGAMAQTYAKTNTDDLANCFVSDTMRQALIGYTWP